MCSAPADSVDVSPWRSDEQWILGRDDLLSHVARRRLYDSGRHAGRDMDRRLPAWKRAPSLGEISMTDFAGRGTALSETVLNPFSLCDWARQGTSAYAVVSSARTGFVNEPIFSI